MNKTWQAVLFVVMSAAMLAAPASQMFRHERVLQQGKAFRFRTQPVDPYDAFRGRYVQLRFENMSAALPAGMDYSRDAEAYARVGEGADGFARLESLSEKPPEGTADYVKVELGWYMDFPTNGYVSVSVPFDQFFMNEKLAPKAEQAYRNLNRRGGTNVWAVVRVLEGKGVIENLMFDGVPAAEYVRAQQE
jgi:uncharacterized membrane-anchored protein